MSSDTTVGIIPPGSPTAYVDNSSITNDAGTAVLRQRVEDPVLISLIDSFRALLNNLGMAIDPTTGRMRVLIDPVGGAQTLGTITTITNAVATTISSGTVTTITNPVPIGITGGWNNQHVVPATMQFPINQLRAGITIS